MSLVPLTCGCSWISLFPASPASCEPRGQDPAFLQVCGHHSAGWRPCGTACATEHTGRWTGNTRNLYFPCFFFPFQLFRGRGVRGGEGPPKKPHTETQSSGESCICGKSKRGQVQVRVTKGSLSPKAVAAARLLHRSNKTGVAETFSERVSFRATQRPFRERCSSTKSTEAKITTAPSVEKINSVSKINKKIRLSLLLLKQHSRAPFAATEQMFAC